MTLYFFSGFLFLFGLAIGCFLNVVIYRLFSGQSIIFGRSRCPQCKKDIFWHDNIPILSFINLSGRCRFCEKKISFQYPLVEFFTALIFVLFYLKFGLTLQFLVYLIFTGFLIVIFVYDLKYYLILDRITIPAIIIAILLNLYLGINFWILLSGAIIGGGFFLIQLLISSGRWIGGGDIRLGILMGAMLGWQKLLAALFLAYILGAIIGIILIILKKKKMSSLVPFGTFLSLATLIILLWGEAILVWYLNLIF